MIYFAVSKQGMKQSMGKTPLWEPLGSNEIRMVTFFNVIYLFICLFIYFHDFFIFEIMERSAI